LMPPALQSLNDGAASLNNAATSLVNQIAAIDPVGAGNPGLMTAATVAGIPLTGDPMFANSSMFAGNPMFASDPMFASSAMIAGTPAIVGNSVLSSDGTMAPNTTDPGLNSIPSGMANNTLFNTPLANSLAGAGLVPGSTTVPSLSSGGAATVANAVQNAAAQSALLQNAALQAAAQNNPFVNPAAVDSVFSSPNESSLIGSAARNPTFLSSFSQPDSINNVLPPLSGSAGTFGF